MENKKVWQRGTITDNGKMTLANDVYFGEEGLKLITEEIKAYNEFYKSKGWGLKAVLVVSGHYEIVE